MRTNVVFQTYGPRVCVCTMHARAHYRSHCVQYGDVTTSSKTLWHCVTVSKLIAYSHMLHNTSGCMNVHKYPVCNNEYTDP